MESLGRDFTLARLAAARTMAQATVDGIDILIESFVVESDINRTEVFESVIEESGNASRALECAQMAYESLDKDERDEGEPDYDQFGEDV